VLACAGLLRVTVGQLDGGQCHAEADDVGQHVSGIGEQRQGVGEQSTDRFDDEVAGDQDEGDQQALLVPGPGPERAASVVVVPAHGVASPTVRA
jgi:hypothetical protein